MASGIVTERSTEQASVSDEVISAVAAARGADPLDLDPLYEAIDPDALDSLYRRGGRERENTPERLEFTYSGCGVVVAEDGSVTVTDAASGDT